MGGDRRLHNQPLPPRRRARAACHADALPHRGRRLELLPRGAGDINAPGPPSARGARRSTNLRCGVPYIPTFPYDDSDARKDSGRLRQKWADFGPGTLNFDQLKILRNLDFSNPPLF